MISIVGKENITEWKNITLRLQTTIFSLVKSILVFSYITYPYTQAELGEVIAKAYSNRWLALVCRSWSKLHWGSLAKNIDVVISTIHLNWIIRHAVANLIVTVETGTKVADLQKTLAQLNQFIALEPAYPDGATIGGILLKPILVLYVNITAA